MTMLLAIVRAFIGPSVYDRILAVNMFGTKTVILIGVLGYLTGRPAFLDIALVYALMNFITTIAVLRYSDFEESPEPNPHAEQEGHYDGTSCRGFVLLVGTLICLVGAIGLLRLPNFFARTHGASITDTLGATLCLLGMVVISLGMDETLKFNLLVIVKLVSIGVFLLVTSPIAGHALTRAAYRKGLAGEGAPDLDDVESLPFGIHGPADISRTFGRRS